MSEPVIGDAFGAMLSAFWTLLSAGEEDPDITEIIERDDGFIIAQRPGRYFAAPASWTDFERTALGLAAGRAAVLDIGCGAGRFALALQELGTPVTGLDVSAGAVGVCRQRGVEDVILGSVTAKPGPAYDTFLLMGENIGLLESGQRAAVFLRALAGHARPGARIIGHGADPGGQPGEMTIRVRFRNLATAWFGYLLCSPGQLAALAEPAGWQLTSADYADPVNYLTVLTLVSRPS
jgi:SAM-dependent methyltransferase